MSRRFMLVGPVALCLIGSSPALAQTTAAATQDTLAAAGEFVVALRAADQVKQILPAPLRPIVVRGGPRPKRISTHWCQRFLIA